MALPPPGAEFTLNVILHVFVMLLALTVLYILVVVPQETSMLTKELANTFGSAVDAGWAAMVTTADADWASMVTTAGADRVPMVTANHGSQLLQPALALALPFLGRLSEKYSKRDAAADAANASTLGISFAVLFMLLLTFVLIACVMKWSGVDVRSMLFRVGIENLVVLGVVGAAEGLFFLLVASHYIPVLPSAITSSIFALFQPSVS